MTSKNNNFKENPPFLKSIYEGAALPMFVIAVSEDNKLIFEGVNPATEKLTGLKDSRVKGKSPEDLTDLPKEIRKAFRSNYEKCLETGHSIQYRETIPVNNKLTHWFTTLNPIKNSKGKIIRIVGTSMPVNELVETQQKLEETKSKLEERVKEGTDNLRKSKARHRTIFEEASDAFIITDLSGKIAEVNPAACKTYGYTYSEMIGKNVAKLMHPDYRRKIPDLAQLIQKAGSFEGEGLDIKKDGSAFHTEVKGSAISFNDKIHSLIIIRDVSEKKEFSLKLEKEKQFNDAVINALPGVFYIIDKNSRYIRWNKTMEKLTGYNAEKMSNISPLETIAPYHRKKVATAIKNVFETGSDDIEADFLTTEGTVPYLFSGVLIEYNEELLLLGVGINISKRKKAEKQREQVLKDLNERMKEISCLFVINEAIKNPDVSIPEVMDKITQAIPNGWQYPEKTAVKVLLDKTEYRTNRYEESTTFIEEKIFIRNKLRGKIEVFVFDLDEEQKKQAFLAEEKKLLKTICNNIEIYVSRVEDEAAKKEMREELLRSNKELEQFAYVASHDLQEPLRMVSSYTQMLQRRYKSKLDEKADKYIYYAVDGASRMQNLINDLLEFSRVTTHGKEFVKTDMNDAVQSAMQELQLKITESGANVTCDKLPVVKADIGQMRRLFLNLIGNALKFHRANEKPEVHISARQKGGKWLFSVKDNGIGIDEKFKDKIFVIFQRLHSSTKYKGTGIGLAVCKQIVNRHGGDIWFDSKENEGTVFHFTMEKINSINSNKSN